MLLPVLMIIVRSSGAGAVPRGEELGGQRRCRACGRIVSWTFHGASVARRDRLGSSSCGAAALVRVSRIYLRQRIQPGECGFSLKRVRSEETVVGNLTAVSNGHPQRAGFTRGGTSSPVVPPTIRRLLRVRPRGATSQTPTHPTAGWGLQGVRYVRPKVGERVIVEVLPSEEVVPGRGRVRSNHTGVRNRPRDAVGSAAGTRHCHPY